MGRQLPSHLLTSGLSTSKLLDPVSVFLNNFFFHFWVGLVAILFVLGGSGVRLVAHVSRNGIGGNVTFEQTAAGEAVTVKFALESVPRDAPPPSEPLQITIHANPVDYSLREPCRGLGDDV